MDFRERSPPMPASASNDFVKNHLFLAGMALVVNCLLAMFFLGVSWFVGGETFINSLYGKETLVILAVAVVVGAAMALVFRGGKPLTA
jgi:hypothetical protein